MGLGVGTVEVMVSAYQTPDDPATPEFDAYTATYNEEINKALNFSGLDIDFFARVKNEYLVDILNARLGGAGKVQLLDVGCGVANAHRQLVGRVGELSGIDVSTASIAVARQRNPGIRYEVFDGITSPLPTGRSMRLLRSMCFIMSRSRNDPPWLMISTACCGRTGCSQYSSTIL